MLKAWLTFTKERFEPISHLVMIGLFSLTHFAVFESQPSLIHSMILFAGVLAFFFKLRLFDEIKDYETDLKFNPSRPLARGLLQHRDLYFGIGLCTTIELLVFLGILYLQSAELSTYLMPLITVGYSFLMFKEFFIPHLIRPHLTTYAVSHTFVSSLLSLNLFCILSGLPFWKLSTNYILFALSSWCLFNIFEFGRKTFHASEERSNVESYSKIFRPLGALLLVQSMAVLGGVLIIMSVGSTQSLTVFSQIGLLGLLTLGGLTYLVGQKSVFAKIYRGLTSAYIVLVYLSIYIIEVTYAH